MAEPITPTPNHEDDTTGSEKPPAFTDFDAFLAAQPEDVKALYAAKTAGLTGALEKEREKAKTASAQLREMAKTADPDTAEKLRKAADEKDAENKALKTQLEFQTAAVALGCRAVDKAWTYAKASGLTAEQMKADPDLTHWFTQPAAPPRTNAGNGAGQPIGTVDMDSLMRARLGRG